MLVEIVNSGARVCDMGRLMRACQMPTCSTQMGALRAPILRPQLARRYGNREHRSCTLIGRQIHKAAFEVSS